MGDIDEICVLSAENAR